MDIEPYEKTLKGTVAKADQYSTKAAAPFLLFPSDLIPRPCKNCRRKMSSGHLSACTGEVYLKKIA